MNSQQASPSTSRRCRRSAFAAGVFAIAATASLGSSFGQSKAAGVVPGDTTFVPIEPCRLFDTRPGPDQVGPRQTPIGPGETYTQPVTGAHGHCVVPGHATAVGMNATAVGATEPSFAVFFPTGAALPLASHLNYLPGQAPTPNKVDVKLSADGTVDVHNGFGSVHLLADVTGYYTPATVDDLSRRVAELEASASASATEPDVLARLEALETKMEPISLETVDGYRTLRISEANLQLVDGSGDTDGAPNGLGNLLVGYAERHPGTDRHGSHNVVLGLRNEWSSFGGLVSGSRNRIGGEHVAAIGGQDNDVAGTGAVAVGGWTVDVSGVGAVGVGGIANVVSGERAVAVGGFGNTASGLRSLAAGGSDNAPTGDRSTTIGGYHNDATGVGATATGGNANTASGTSSVVAGGSNNTAAGSNSSVVGSQASTSVGSESVSVGDHDTESLFRATSIGERERTCTNQATCLEPGLLATSVSVLADGTNSGPLGLTTTRLGIGEYEFVLDTDLFGTVNIDRRPHFTATPFCPAGVGVTGTETTSDGTHLQSVTARVAVVAGAGFIDCPVHLTVNFDRP